MGEDSSFEWYSDLGQRIVVQYSSWTKQGADPYGRAKSNQDSYIVKEAFGGEDCSFFGVFDGHGGEGAKISQHLVKNLPDRLSDSDEFKARDYVEMFERHMPLGNKQLMSTSGIKTQLSGSTAAIATLDSSALLTVANVGDSRCILGRMNGNEAMAIALTTDHTPEVPSEAARIMACKGRIQPYEFNGDYVGPKRIWVHNRDYPGLAMTRAFGDEVGSTIGIISDPEVTQVYLQEHDRYLVLCSDGIYEFMDNDYIMSIVHHQAQCGWSPSDVAKCLVAEANRQWMEEEDGIIDDCTVIVIFLDITPPSPMASKLPAEPESPKVASRKNSFLEGGPVSMERSVSKTLGQVARRASALLSPREFKQKCGVTQQKHPRQLL